MCFVKYMCFVRYTVINSVYICIHNSGQPVLSDRVHVLSNVFTVYYLGSVRPPRVSSVGQASHLHTDVILGNLSREASECTAS
jgi:hypothetical protein